MMFNIPANSLIVMGLVLGLLVIASLVCYGLQLKNPQKDLSNLKLRIKSWWWMIGVLFLALSFDERITIIFFAIISFLLLKEFLSIVPGRQTDRRVVFWLYLSIPVQYYWVSSAWYGMFIIFIPVYVFLLTPIRMVLTQNTKGFIKAAGIMNWAVMTSVFSISHIAYLLMLPEVNVQAGDIGLVIFLLLITQLNDVCQYIFGKLFGRHRIIPLVSPNKTWEGFIGGVVSAMSIACVLAPLLTPLTNLEGLGAGLIIAIFGFFGDVVISSVKRDLRIKDSGMMIPGHGGILDRMDSLLYTTPVFFHYLYYLHY